MELIFSVQSFQRNKEGTYFWIIRTASFRVFVCSILYEEIGVQSGNEGQGEKEGRNEEEMRFCSI